MEVLPRAAAACEMEGECLLQLERSSSVPIIRVLFEKMQCISRALGRALAKG